MAKQEGGNWWGVTNAEDWQNETDVFALWCLARDQARFNRRLVNRSRVKDYNRRLLYLLGVAIWRRAEYLLPDPCCHKALETAEAFAEGTANFEDMEASCDAVDRVPVRDEPQIVTVALRSLFWLVCSDKSKLTEGLELLVDVAGYRAAMDAGIPVTKGGFAGRQAVWEHPVFIAGKQEEEEALCGIVRDVLGNPFRPVKFSPKWRTSTAVALAKQMYKSNDFGAMPILADALQDAGCGSEEVLGHCRDAKQTHVRGCWVVDGVLGK
jgi:hypothetical protein